MAKHLFKKGYVPWNKGKKLTEKQRGQLSKIAISMGFGKWNKGVYRTIPIKMYICKVCGKEFHREPSRLKLGYCSKTCSKLGKNNPMFGMYREKNPNWKGGKVITNGYIVITFENKGRIGQHRLVMEKHLHRHLRSNEFVHHINRNRNDNRIENLQVMTDIEHRKLHNLTIKEDKWNKKLLK